MYGIYNQIFKFVLKFRTMKIISLTIVAKMFTHENDPQNCISVIIYVDVNVRTRST